MRNDTVMAIKLPKKTKTNLEEKADELGLTMSQITRKLIEDWLMTDPKRKPFGY